MIESSAQGGNKRIKARILTKAHSFAKDVLKEIDNPQRQQVVKQFIQTINTLRISSSGWCGCFLAELLEKQDFCRKKI